MRTLVRATGRLLIGATSIYCVGMIALAAIWATKAYQSWWLELLNVFALYLFAPLLLLIPAALVVRSRWLRGAVAAAALLFLALFGAHLIPPRVDPAVETNLRVATFNHLYDNEDTDGIVAAIRAQRADIVALQELSEPVALAARQQLGAEYPYQYLVPSDGDWGLGILSRYPLRSTELIEDYSAQRATVDLGGQQLTLINVHLTAPSVKTRRFRPFRRVKVLLDYNTSRRAHEVPRLLDAIDRTKGPLIVLGDFNTGDREPPYAELAARMHDAYRETNWGFGFTFPTRRQVGPIVIPFPLVRIDYVWSKGGIVPAAARVECASGGSDHCLLRADLQVGSGRGIAESRN